MTVHFLRYKTKGVFVREYVQAVAVGDGETSATNNVQTAVPAGNAAVSIRIRQGGMINFRQPALQYIADGGWKFPAGMDFTVRQQRDKIKGGTASIAGTPAKRLYAVLTSDDIDQVVL